MAMLTLRALLLRVTNAPRAREYDALRSRSRVLSERFSERERQLATTLLSLKKEMSARFNQVRSCATCNKAHPRPEGPWPGGYCCSSPTTNLFDDEELAALLAAGVTTEQLHPPREPKHGCVFRGERGCSLRAEQRPTICVRYTCVTLELELARDGKIEEIEASSKQLSAVFEEFCQVRAKRREDEEFNTLLGEEP